MGITAVLAALNTALVTGECDDFITPLSPIDSPESSESLNRFKTEFSIVRLPIRGYIASLEKQLSLPREQLVPGEDLVLKYKRLDLSVAVLLLEGRIKILEKLQKRPSVSDIKLLEKLRTMVLAMDLPKTTIDVSKMLLVDKNDTCYWFDVVSSIPQIESASEYDKDAVNGFLEYISSLYETGAHMDLQTSIEFLLKLVPLEDAIKRTARQWAGDNKDSMEYFRTKAVILREKIATLFQNNSYLPILAARKFPFKETLKLIGNSLDFRIQHLLYVIKSFEKDPRLNMQHIRASSQYRQIVTDLEMLQGGTTLDDQKVANYLQKVSKDCHEAINDFLGHSVLTPDQTLDLILFSGRFMELELAMSDEAELPPARSMTIIFRGMSRMYESTVRRILDMAVDKGPDRINYIAVSKKDFDVALKKINEGYTNQLLEDEVRFVSWMHLNHDEIEKSAESIGLNAHNYSSIISIWRDLEWREMKDNINRITVKIAPEMMYSLLQNLQMGHIVWAEAARRILDTKRHRGMFPVFLYQVTEKLIAQSMGRSHPREYIDRLRIIRGQLSQMHGKEFTDAQTEILNCARFLLMIVDKYEPDIQRETDFSATRENQLAKELKKQTYIKSEDLSLDLDKLYVAVDRLQDEVKQCAYHEREKCEISHVLGVSAPIAIIYRSVLTSILASNVRWKIKKFKSKGNCTVADIRKLHSDLEAIKDALGSDLPTKGSKRHISPSDTPLTSIKMHVNMHIASFSAWDRLLEDMLSEPSLPASDRKKIGTFLKFSVAARKNMEDVVKRKDVEKIRKALSKSYRDTINAYEVVKDALDRTSRV